MEVYELIQEPRVCSYLADHMAKFHYFYIKDCSVSFYVHLLERGWRRFGNYFFAPICEECVACISIRQDCSLFNFSKSHQRVLKQPIVTQIRRPWVSEAHLKLYDKYHQMMQTKKGWTHQNITLEVYYDTFVQGFLDFGYELDYYIENKLVGVAFMDIMEGAISGVYCYYDHDYARYSIGTYSILKQIQIAKSYNIRYLYPGYWIPNHISMGYKERFKPFEILCNRPSLEEKPLWVKE